MSDAFLSCDWGTSSFRLRWMDGTHILREYRDNTGCKALYEQATATGSARPEVYAEFLGAVLERWREFAPSVPIPLVISGMASSTIGWRELPYASVPIRLNAGNLVFESLKWDQPSWVGETFLISGVASHRDIMRGEETEAIGLLAGQTGDCVLILPGTHSKHLIIRAGLITDFSTYMTGELFDVLARHSILRTSVDRESLSELSHPHLTAFDEGVHEAAERGLCVSLFQARTRAVLDGHSTSANTWFLSGLLIGAELAGRCQDQPQGPILVGGSGHFRALYGRALKTLQMTEGPEFDDGVVELAVPRAHLLFLNCARS